MKTVLQYSLGPLPWALATPDGNLAKTNKAKLMHLLEEGTEPEEDIPAWILDGMAILQSLNQLPRTFGKLAKLVFGIVINKHHTTGG